VGFSPAIDVRGILGVDSDVRNGFSDNKVTYKIDADASPDDIKALVAQSQSGPPCTTSSRIPRT
jgi:hypothetical protein